MMEPVAMSGAVSLESQDTHIDEEILELYVLGMRNETELDSIEAHLLICHRCQDRLRDADDYIRTVRAACFEVGWAARMAVESKTCAVIS
jgi:hypothetical protein